MHDGPAWPLHLVPRRLPLAPTWQIGYPPSGDYIAECVTNGFTLDEILTLCERMATSWNQGVRILKQLRRHFQSNPERLADIRLATVLGLQFRSGYHIIRFYHLREQLADTRKPGKRQALLQEMKRIVRAELKVSAELLPLAEADSRLGFHSEAEGYKYFPALIRWRIEQLQNLLRREFPLVERQARHDEPLFPDYTGEQPADEAYTCSHISAPPTLDSKLSDPPWDSQPQAECIHWLHQVYSQERWSKCGYDRFDHHPVPPADRAGRTTCWKAVANQDALHIAILCGPGANATSTTAFKGNSLQLFIEPERTRPRVLFHINPDGSARCVKDDGYIPRDDDPWRVSSHVDKNGWSTVLEIPLPWLRPDSDALFRPLRINLVRAMPIPGKGGTALCSWARQEPVKGRLVWGTLNPATDFGWLRFAT